MEPERDTLIERVPDTVALRTIVPLPDRHSVGDRVMLAVTDPDLLAEGLLEFVPDTVPDRLCVRLVKGEAEALLQGDGDGLDDGEGVPVLHREIVGDTEADLVTDTLAVPLLVKGCVVPTAVKVGLDAPLREAPEPLTAKDALPEGVTDTVTLPERLLLGQGLAELVRHSEGETDEERVGLLLALMLRVTDTVTEGEEVEEGLILDV